MAEAQRHKQKQRESNIDRCWELMHLKMKNPGTRLSDFDARNARVSHVFSDRLRLQMERTAGTRTTFCSCGLFDNLRTIKPIEMVNNR